MGTTAEKLTYLNETKQELKEAINNLGGSIDNSTTFREYVEELEDIYSNLPKVTSEGTEVTLTPTKKGKLSLVEKGNSEQEGTPTPSTPIPIKSVTGNNNVVVQNKNLFNKGNYNQYSGYFLNNSIVSNNANNIIYIPCKRNTTYTVSKVITQNFGLACSVDVPNNNVAITNKISANNQASATITTDNTCNYLVAWVRNGNLSNEPSYTEVINSIQIEEGSTATSYEEHKETTLPLNLGTIELNKIGTYQDYIYKNNGKWYKHLAVRKLELAIADMNNSEDYPGWINQTQLKADLPNTNNRLYTATHYLSNINIEGTTAQTDGISINTNGTGTIFLVKTFFNLTQTQWKSTYPNLVLTLYYGLPQDKQEDIEITDTNLINQLNAIDNMKSYEGTTIITSTYTEGNAQMIISASSLKGE